MESILIDSHYQLANKNDNDYDNSHCPRDMEPIIELKNIHKTYLLGIEGVPALRGVSLTIYPGEFIVVYGTSGGGKTSLLNVIGTIDKPTKGELKLAGLTINSKTTDLQLSKIRLSKLGFVFQTFNLLSSMTARENVELPMILKAQLPAAERRRLAEDSLKRVGLGHRLDHFPPQLSGGEQQRVTIARALANSPDLLLLDEPTGDLDSNNADHVMKILVKMNRDRRMTMVMVTHDMALKNFADRVVWMRDGKIARIERIAADKRQNVHQELTARLAAAANNNSNSSGELAGGDLLASNICRTEYRQPAFYPALRKQTAATAQSTQPCLHSKSQTLQSTLSNMKTLAESSPVQQRNYSTNPTTLFDNQNDRIILATHEMSP